jgi:hypothetical protein
VRCTTCASAKRKCSLVEDAKPIKSSPAKTHRSLPDSEAPIVASTPSNKKGKGVLSALVKPFKRKTEDRSPEAPQLSKKPSLRPISPSISLVRAQASKSGDPPLTQTPSFTSFDSIGSEPGANFEADHLRLMLTASQDDLRLERERALEREQRLTSSFDVERRYYEAKIRDLERSAWGAGPSRRK